MHTTWKSTNVALAVFLTVAHQLPLKCFSLDITWFLLNRQAKVDSCYLDFLIYPWVFILFANISRHWRRAKLGEKQRFTPNCFASLRRNDFLCHHDWTYFIDVFDFTTKQDVDLTFIHRYCNSFKSCPAKQVRNLLFLALTRNASELCFWTEVMDFPSSLASVSTT